MLQQLCQQQQFVVDSQLVEQLAVRLKSSNEKLKIKMILI